MSDETAACEQCALGGRTAFRTPFSMAFQPIIDINDGRIYAHEALVRGLDGSSAWSVLSQLTDETRYSFDQSSRVRAISLAQSLGLTQRLSINFMPNAIYEPTRCLAATLAAAEKTGFPLQQIMFELTETEEIVDIAHVRNIIETYREAGFRTAIDDFGAGYAGLDLLAEIQPDVLKIDIKLVRDVDTDPRRRKIIDAIVGLCSALGIETVAEGIETAGELAALRESGVDMAQGYFIGRPLFEGLACQSQVDAVLGQSVSRVA